MNDYENHAWYCVLRGNRLGPMPWETLRARARRGEIRPDDLVWAAPFQAAWRPAGTVEGLFAGEPAPPTPPPEPAAAWGAADAREAAGGRGPHAAPSSRRAFRQVWQRMVQTLFRPFDLARWFSIGFCAWLAQIGSGPNLQGLVDVEAFKRQVEAGTASATSLVSMMLDKLASTPLLTAAALAAVVFSLLASVLLCWLRARGSLMFLHRIYRPNATIREAWQVAGPSGRALFWWRLGLGAIGWLALLALGSGAAVSLGLGLLRSRDWAGIGAAVTLPWALVWGGGLVFLLLVWGTVKSLSFHFMEPCLYRDGAGVWAAWQRVWALCRDYPLAVTRFYVLLTLLMLAAGIAVMAFILFSCCLGFFLLLMPVVGAVALLPLLWLLRGFGAAFIDAGE